MNIEDINIYIIKKNLINNNRNRYFIDNRMYIYAILYHIHKWTISSIAKKFKKNHATIKNALEQADSIQSDETFIENCKELQEQFFLIIPPYNKKNIKKETEEEYTINLKLNKKQYFEYLNRKNIDDIYDLLWQQTLKEAKKYNKNNTSKKLKYKQH